MKLKLNKNGFIVKKKTEYKFYGLTDDIWPIDLDTPKLEKKIKEKLFDYCESNIIRSWEDDEFVEVSNDINFVNQYLDACKQADIKCQVIFCCSEKSYPKSDINLKGLYAHQFVFLGYDYAYPGGSFYSCIYNDLFIRKIEQFNGFSLNQYGLFEKEEELLEFIRFRAELQKKLSGNLFEQGDFIIYQLWEYVGNFPVSIPLK